MSDTHEQFGRDTLVYWVGTADGDGWSWGGDPLRDDDDPTGLSEARKLARSELVTRVVIADNTGAREEMRVWGDLADIVIRHRRVTDVMVYPDGDIRIYLSDGTIVDAGTEWETDGHPECEGEMWLYATRYGFGDGAGSELINERWEGANVVATGSIASIHDLHMEGEGEIVARILDELKVHPDNRAGY